MAAEYWRDEHATSLLLPPSPFFSGNYSIGLYSLSFFLVNPGISVINKDGNFYDDFFF